MGLKKIILRKLYRHRIIGGKHTAIDHLTKGLPKHIAGKAKDAVSELIKEGFILSKPTSLKFATLVIKPLTISFIKILTIFLGKPFLGSFLLTLVKIRQNLKSIPIIVFLKSYRLSHSPFWAKRIESTVPKFLKPFVLITLSKNIRAGPSAGLRTSCITNQPPSFKNSSHAKSLFTFS